MNAASIRPIASDELTAEGASIGDVVEVRIRGSAELGAKALLDQFFADVFGARAGCRTVVVDVRGLEYMNSSSFKSLLTWLVQVRELPEPERHTIRFLSNPSYHWQRRSLHSLVSMGGDLVEVEERAETP